MITMNKKGHKNQAERSSRRLWITLLFFCFTVTGFMQAANAVFAQTTVTATFKNATLSEVAVGSSEDKQISPLCIALKR